MNDDAELLRVYAESRSDSAFTALVQRHIGLAYATALRRVGGDAHLAEDVVQSVFTDLARKAGALRHRASVAGWVYWSAHVESAAVVRSERRRKNREITAMDPSLSSHDCPADWDRIRPVLDDAMAGLSHDDREAVVLRFFQRRSFAEVGAALRVSDEAARKRVDRALDKLREALVRRGVVSTGTALGLALGEAAAAPVPGQLAGMVAAHAVEAAASGTSLLTAVATTVLPAAAIFAVGTWLVAQQYSGQTALRGELAQLQQQIGAGDDLRTDNDRLRNALQEADNLRRAAADLPKLRAEVAASALASPPRRSASVTLTPAGTIRWGDEFVTLTDFENRMKAHVADSHGESEIVVHATGANYNALLYIIDEARKLETTHLVIESDAIPQPNHPMIGRFSWF